MTTGDALPGEREYDEKRWRRYGHDRIYVSTSDGVQVGYVDLKTGATEASEVGHDAALADCRSRWEETINGGTGSAPKGPAEELLDLPAADASAVAPAVVTPPPPVIGGVSPDVARPVAPAAMTDREKGARFEQQVARALNADGYDTATNQWREGRSGVKHEIDVIGRKAEGGTATELLVECKAWESAVTKDVVFKFSGILDDLGLRGGVIAALNGFTADAETMANAHGITLWDSGELDRRLGRAATTALSSRGPTAATVGFRRTTSTEDARAMVLQATRGLLGKEVVVWSEDLWLPIAYVQLALTTEVGVIRKTRQTERRWNAYDLVSGNVVRWRTQEHEGASVDVDGRLVNGPVKVDQPAKDIDKAIYKLRSVSSETAINKHAATVAALGVPTNCKVVVESTKKWVFPIHVAVAQRRNVERLIVIDCFEGKVHDLMTSSLTPHGGRIRDSFG